METEWKAKTGRISLLTRSAATVRLAYAVSRSVKKLEHELASQPDLDKEIVEKRWNQLHRKNAKLVHQHILKYRGFLTKFGQAASTKAGSLPAPWVEELRDLQDELPISNYQEVVRTIKTDLGRPLEETFRDFGQRPIASASVGQAHMAWLRSSGQKVCVKVQHHGVGSLMKTDLVTIEFIAAKMMKLHKGAPDFTDLIREWRRAAVEEVDFQLEAKNAMQAANALRRHSVDVTCPEPLLNLCSRRVLTMVFIEGWKITDLDRMPYGADREGLARNLVHAFALLVFQEGLIHGDPHPGNVFVEQVPGGDAKQVRPVLLDWGIVKRLTHEERLAAAKWIISVLAQDRQLHISSLLDLGFEFDADPDLPEFATFIEASMSQCAFLFRDSIPSSSQINFLQQMNEHQERAENQEKEGKDGKDQSKLIGKVPGVVLFFLRGLEMLQNICGMLEVTVPFATIMLENCMPLLASRGSWSPAVALPGPPGQSVLEQKVRAKLNDLDRKGLVLGAQVAVWDRRLGTRGEFLCSAACGRLGVCQWVPISDQTVMPLMSLSAGPLLHCLLRALSHPTAQGKQVSFNTSIPEIWPDFSQRGKTATIGDVLQHQAGLAKPFPSDMSIKAFCSETRMEEAIASAPLCPEDEGLCPVWGDALAALLKRIVGRKSTQDALTQTLGSMAGEITYRAPTNCHTAFAGRKPQERVTMQSIYEWLEEKVESLDSMAHNNNSSTVRRRWLSETELAVERPWMTDPMIVNREALLIGHSCLAGRGLRASAKTLCRMFTADLVPAEMLAKSLEPGREVKFRTLQQWWDSVGAPQRALGGWQLFPFKTKKEEVQGYGFSDGATGSMVLRLPEVTLAILLSSCSPKTRHAGRSLLETICAELGLEVGWPAEPPSLPKRPGGAAKNLSTKSESSKVADGRRPDDLQQELAKVEAKVAKLSEVLELLLPGASEAICGVPPPSAVPQRPQRTMAGFWLSDETEGLESLLEALQVPAMMRSMASAAQRSLQIDIEGNEVQISSTTSMLGRQLEETTTRFQVGSSFSGEQALGGAFTAMASWIEDKEPQQPASLHLVKQFATEGIQLDELFFLQQDSRLALTTTLSSSQHQFEDRKVELHRQEELEAFCAELGEDLILKRQLSLPGAIKALPGGSRVTGLGPVGADAADQEGPTLTDLKKIQLPTSVFLCVEAIRSTTYFSKEGGSEGIGESVPSELLESLPPEIRTALAERQEAYQAYQSPSPSSAASPLTVMKAPSAGPKSAPKIEAARASRASFFWTALGVASWAACSALGQAGKLTTRASLYVCQAACQAPNLCPLPSSILRPKAAEDEYVISVDRTMGQRLGLRVDKEDGEVFILEVQPGLVQEWNEANPDCQVRVGDVLLEVNGQSGDTRTLMELCKSCQPLEMKLRRELLEPESPEKVKAQEVNKADFGEALDKKEHKAEDKVEETSVGGDQVQAAAASSQALEKLQLPKVPEPSESSAASGASCGPLRRQQREHRREEVQSSSEKYRCRRDEPKALVLEDPVVGATFADPRFRQQKLGIIAFSRLDPDLCPLSQLCRAQVLSNAFDLGRAGLVLAAPCSRSSSRFRNAEAAYQATWNWPLSGLFQELGPVAAIRKVQRFGTYRDQTRGGFVNSWRAMRAVLEAKFAPNSAVAAVLLKSGDAFLLDTGEALQSDPPLEDMPENWIGLLLMIVRDKLSKSTAWTEYIQNVCDLENGKGSKASLTWQADVQAAKAAIQNQSSLKLADMDAV